MGHTKGKPAWNKGSGKPCLSPRGYLVMNSYQDGRKRVKHLHRILMEEHLGRKLEPWELVHHKDGDKLNNAIKNLQVMTFAEHTIAHHCGSKRPSQAKQTAATFRQMREEIHHLRRVLPEYSAMLALLKRVLPDISVSAPFECLEEARAILKRIED